MDTNILALAHELNNLPLYTLEYKLPRQRKWRHGFSMKSAEYLEAKRPEFVAMLAVDNLCQSHKIKTRVI